MKYLNLLLITAFATMFLSCNKEINQKQAGENNVITQISATFYNNDSKTILGEDGTSILWSPNDEISVFYNGDGVKFTSINSTAKNRTIFRSDYSLIYGGTETSDEPYIYGIYPYSIYNSQNGEELTLTVQTTQTAVEGSFGRGSYPSVGRSKNTDMAFYNVCGGVRFSLTQSGIRRIVLSSNGGETLSGRVEVKFDESGYPMLSDVVYGSSSVCLNAPDANGFQTGKWYYISMLPTSLSTGFGIEFIKREDESERGMRIISSPVEVKRSVFGSVEDIDKNVEFEVGIASLSISPENVLIAPMSTTQLSLTASPTDAKWKSITWSSSDNTIASVDENGMVAGNKDGVCVITATSDNGKSASCRVYVSQNPVSTKEATAVLYSKATIGGSFNIAGAESASKSVFFLYSDTESTLEGLISNGIKLESTLSGYEFSATLENLKYVTKYNYTAAVDFLGQTYYGEVKNFTLISLPEGPVDLGLSVKWASVNIEASTPMDYGRYFAWGDITGQTWDGEQWSGGGFYAAPAYEVDDNRNLKPEYDAAHIILGGDWRMPTHAEQQELIDNCTSEWTTIHGVYGLLLTSNKTGYTNNAIFLPAAGNGYRNILQDTSLMGLYWSSTFYDYPGDDDYAWCLAFDAYSYTNLGYWASLTRTNRYCARSVRPVSK